MATVNFSVPEDVKRDFNVVFAGRNKSAVLTQLMREAVERAQQQARREAAARRILQRLRKAPLGDSGSLHAARAQGRP